MSCDHCSHLLVTHRIALPKDLKNVIALVSENISNGILKEAAPKNNVVRQPPFTALVAGEPWEDIVSYTFECQTCGQRFALGAETYHGSGGSWTPVP